MNTRINVGYEIQATVFNGTSNIRLSATLRLQQWGRKSSLHCLQIIFPIRIRVAFGEELSKLTGYMTIRWSIVPHRYVDLGRRMGILWSNLEVIQNPSRAMIVGGQIPGGFEVLFIPQKKPP